MVSINNYVYRCLNEYNEVIYVGKLIKLGICINDYFKNEEELLNEEFFLDTYKIEVLKVNYEIDAYSVNAYLIDKYNPKYNTNKQHYKNINPINTYNESEWKLVRIVNPDLIPIQENRSLLSEYFHIIIIFIVIIIILALYRIKYLYGLY